MAANTATKTASSPCHCTFVLTGNGDVAGPTIDNAAILAAMVPGPLKAAWSKTYASQAAMRTALLGGGEQCTASIQLAATGNDVTAETNQVVADVDVDAVTPTKAEINIGMSDTTGQLAYLTLTYQHSMVK